MDITDFKEFVRKIPVFSICSETELKQLVGLARFKTASPGEILFRQNEPGNEFFIVLSGKIRLIICDDQKREINLGVCSSGDHIGSESAVTGNINLHTARAVDESTLLSFDSRSFLDFLSDKPEILQYFDRFVRFSAINIFLKSCTDLSTVTPAELKDLILSFNSEYFRSGEVVFRQGTPPDKFYLIEKGKVKVIRRESNRGETINFHHSGQFFGEKALIEDSTRHADVICISDCHFFTISRDSFQRLILSSPKLKQLIQNRISSYLTSPPVPLTEITVPVIQKAEQENVNSSYNQPSVKKYFFPMIYQDGEMDCGIACLKMIFKYYGKHISAARLKEFSNYTLSGVSLTGISCAAEKIGFVTRAVKTDYSELLNDKKPCILHWEGVHFVVGFRKDESHIWISDPARGQIRLSKEEFCNSWNGIALLLEPGHKFQHIESDPHPLRFFWSMLPDRSDLITKAVALSLFTAVLGLTLPLFIKLLFDNVILKNTLSGGVLIISLCFLLFFRFLLSLVRQKLLLDCGEKLTDSLVRTFYRHLLSLPLHFFHSHTVSDLNLYRHLSSSGSFLVISSFGLITDSLCICVFFTAMFLTDLRLSLISALFFPLFAILNSIFQSSLKSSSDVQSHHNSSEHYFTESVKSAEILKISNAEQYFFWNFEKHFHKALTAEKSYSEKRGIFYAAADFFTLSGFALILFAGASEVSSGKMTAGSLIAFSSLAWFVTSILSRITTSLNNARYLAQTASRIQDILAVPPEHFREEDSVSMILQEIKGFIRFDRVKFSYNENYLPHALNQVSFQAEPGKKIAIIGRHGSGKTAICQLLVKLYDPSSGKITIDGNDIRTLHPGQLRRLIAVIPRNGYIFRATVRENISLWDPEESSSKILEAAKITGAHDFICDLPSGFDTVIGEGGYNLTPGQKQRIAVSRALYSSPSVIVSDDAAGGIDSESAQMIYQCFRQISSGRTMLMISDRINPVRDSDMIHVLDSGEIIESGTHDQLMEKKGLYSYLYIQQQNL